MSSSRVIQNLLNQVDALKKEQSALKGQSRLELIEQQLTNCVEATDLPSDLLPGLEEKYVGKVRDKYVCKDVVVMIATDRQSAFDRHLASVPFKGQVLNLTSKWWFEQTKHIIGNHMIATPHNNVIIGKKCSVFPVEFVMRGYMTGSTSTSMWMNYSKGCRDYCGHKLPDGMVKNQKLWGTLLTPTTKVCVFGMHALLNAILPDALAMFFSSMLFCSRHQSNVHDELISAEEIIKQNIMSQEDWDTCAKAAQSIFNFGQKAAGACTLHLLCLIAYSFSCCCYALLATRGLILVDTKYEFGKDADGTILLIDEVHTPDSSRYWLADTYEERLAAGKNPDNIDKEFLRLWFTANCDPYNDKVLPPAPKDLVCELSRRYIMLYEMITGENFAVAQGDGSPVNLQICDAVRMHFR
jgi:phosphoribosylaminoimidazole-succinocarboxamide synthase